MKKANKDPRLEKLRRFANKVEEATDFFLASLTILVPMAVGLVVLFFVLRWAYVLLSSFFLSLLR